MTQHDPQNVKAVYEFQGFTGTRKTDILLELEESGRVWVTRAEGRYELLGLERELALQLLTARPMANNNSEGLGLGYCPSLGESGNG